jgi:hypothetical protein
MIYLLFIDVQGLNKNYIKKTRIKSVRPDPSTTLRVKGDVEGQVPQLLEDCVSSCGDTPSFAQKLRKGEDGSSGREEEVMVEEFEHGEFPACFRMQKPLE